jgi:iron complex transport system substrate-binding protein
MRFPTMLLAGLVAFSLAACGDDDENSAGPSAPAGSAESGAFPVTIEHKYGSTTIEEAPERVAVVGLREQDALLALGIVPVATSEWYGEHPGAIFPWATDELGDAELPTVLSYKDGIEVEKVAATRPDLILGIYSGMTRKEYDTLSRLAPVVAQPKGLPDYGSSWQDETLMTGEAVGKAEEAQQLVDESEQLIADAAAENPDFAGQQAAIVSDYQGVFVYGPEDVRTRFLEELGFEYPAELREAFPDEFGGQLSEERMDALDVGTLVWFADGDRSEKQLKTDPLYKDLTVRKEGRDVFIAGDDRVYDATSFVSVLSMPTLIDELVPRLAAAADGDPSTSTAQDG